jgi:diacylglycerol kinase family enzyme
VEVGALRQPGPRADSARTRLGVLTNPAALHNHRFPFTHPKVALQLSSTADAVVTADASQVDDAVRHLLLERGVNVLAINGGDGTIHGAVNRMASLLGPEVRAGRVRLPILLLLNGGTYNMASRAMGTKADPLTTVQRFLARWGQRPVSEVPTRDVGLLEVRRRGQDPMLGMFFGSEVVANALALCDRMGSGYLGLGRLLANGTAGFVLRTGWWREESRRLRPTEPTAQVDGTTVTEVSAVVAATLDMMLARGMVWALTTSGTGEGFHAKIIRAKAPGEVVRLLPNLLWELSHPMIHAYPDARRLCLAGSFTLDGELYDHAGPLEVVPGPFRLQIVPGDEL